MTETTYYTKVYDWIAQNKELSLIEKLIICNVLRFQKNGCFESYRSMGRKFGVQHSYIVKAVKSLIVKEWLCVLYETKYKRILFVVPERLKPGPLWEMSGYYRDHLGQKKLESGHHRDHVVKNVSYNEEREERLVNACAELMRDEAKPSRTEFERRKQEQLKALKGERYGEPPNIT